MNTLLLVAVVAQSLLWDPVTVDVNGGPENVVASECRIEGVQAGGRSVAGAPTSCDLAPLVAGLEPGSYSLGVRLRDQAGNWGPFSLPLAYLVAGAPPPPAPQVALWDQSVVPSLPASTDTFSYELGVKFRASVAGSVVGVRFYKGAGNTGAHTGSLWSASGTRLATAAFAAETSTGWQTVLFAAPVPLTIGTLYVASYWCPVGRYAAQSDFFTSPLASGPLTAPAASESPNGLFRGGSAGFPTTTYRAANYWVTPIFEIAPPPFTKIVLTWQDSGKDIDGNAITLDQTEAKIVARGAGSAATALANVQSNQNAIELSALQLAPGSYDAHIRSHSQAGWGDYGQAIQFAWPPSSTQPSQQAPVLMVPARPYGAKAEAKP